MKKLLLIMTIVSSLFFACGTDQAEKERQDSISAAAEADSMLRAEIAADSILNAADSTAVDSLPQ
jgi:hypothetical protein